MHAIHEKIQHLHRRLLLFASDRSLDVPDRAASRASGALSLVDFELTQGDPALGSASDPDVATFRWLEPRDPRDGLPERRRSPAYFGEQSFVERQLEHERKRPRRASRHRGCRSSPFSTSGHFEGRRSPRACVDIGMHAIRRADDDSVDQAAIDCDRKGVLTAAVSDRSIEGYVDRDAEAVNEPREAGNDQQTESDASGGCSGVGYRQWYGPFAAVLATRKGYREPRWTGIATASGSPRVGRSEAWVTRASSAAENHPGSQGAFGSSPARTRAANIVKTSTWDRRSGCLGYQQLRTWLERKGPRLPWRARGRSTMLPFSNMACAAMCWRRCALKAGAGLLALGDAAVGHAAFDRSEHERFP